jgi:AcrR family transcriptional regulator
MPRPALKPRKQPRQQRSAAMVELILAAATRVLERESLAGFNTNRVAEVAGISIGSLYQYFPNKAALVAQLIERAQAELAAGIEAAIAAAAGRPLRQALAELARLAVEQQFARPLLAAALDHEELRLPMQNRIAPAQARLLGAVERLLQEHAGELTVPLPSAAARDCIVIAKALVEAEATRQRQPSADLAARVERALLGYLGLPLRPPPAPAPPRRSARPSRPAPRP